LDQLINESLRDTGPGGTFDLWTLLVALTSSFLLALLLAYVYRQTHRGLSYSVSFVHTMVIMAVTVSVIMMIIGSNIARAFSLVGALSIIRFRSAIKDPRDVAFIFAAMAVGMACGTGFFVTAAVFTLFVSPVVYFLYRFDIGAMSASEVMLKVHLPENLDYHTALNEIFFRFVRDHALLSVETIQGGTLLELVYSLQFKEKASETAFLDALRAANGNNKVVLLTGAQNVVV